MADLELGLPAAERAIEALGLCFLCLRKDDCLTIVYAGAPFYRILGYEEGELTSLLGKDGHGPLLNEPPVDWNWVAAGIAEKGYVRLELKLLRKNGHHLWAEFRVSLSHGENGAALFYGQIQEITLERRSRRLAREQMEELEALTANVPGGVLRCRLDERLTLGLVSEGYCRITGYTREEIRERFDDSFLSMVCEKDRETLMRQIDARSSSRQITEFTYRVTAKGGRQIWVLDRTRRQEDCNGNIWLYSVLIDITEMKHAQDDLAASEERYRLILGHAADPVFDLDFKNRRTYYSPACHSKFGEQLPKFGALMEHIETSDRIYENDRDCVVRYARKWLEGERELGDEECRLKAASGGYIWCNVHPAAFYNPQGALERLIVVVSDIDRRIRETQALRQRAEHDLLTGLYNRVTTTNLINTALRTSGTDDRHALFVVDIDNFKLVNDRLGHLCGDRLIVETAQLIRKNFREEDVIGRVGGDEFVIFLKNFPSLELILNRAEGIGGSLREIRDDTLERIGISGSIGIAFYPHDGKTYEELFRKADCAMYAAKNSGKDTYRVYTRMIETSVSRDDPVS